MPLLPEDIEYLSERGLAYEVHEDGGMTCLILRQWAMPDGLSHALGDVLIRLHPGYPDIAPDMWWVDPPLRCADGAEIPATQSIEPYLGRQWQRWSRHFDAGQWKPGVDRLNSFLALLDGELRRTATGTAA
jgi:hypothetical protein